MNPAQFDKVITAITQAFEDSGKIQDQVYNNHPLFAMLNSKGKKVVRGGREIQVNVRRGKNDTTQSYRGWEPALRRDQENIGHLVFPWAQYRTNIQLPGNIIAMNNSANSIVDLLSTEMQDAVDSMKDLMSAHVYGDGTGNTGRDILGLNAIIRATGTLGGIDRTAATGAFLRSQMNTAAAPVQLGWIRNMVNTIKGSSGGTNTKQGVCDMVLMPQNLFESFEALLMPSVRMEATGLGNIGFSGLAYAGTEIAWDSLQTAGRVDFLSTKYLGLRVMPGRDFTITPWQVPINEDGRVCYVYWMGQLITTNPRRLGAATNKTA